MSFIRKLHFISAIFFVAVLLSGCTTLLVGTAVSAAGAYVWTQGNLQLSVDYSVEQLYDATREALDELNIFIERDRHGSMSANVSARTQQGRKVLIKIVGKTEMSSWIRVRVGVLGDKEESQMVMNVILKNV